MIGKRRLRNYRRPTVGFTQADKSRRKDSLPKGNNPMGRLVKAEEKKGQGQ